MKKLRCEGISALIIAGVLYSGCLLPEPAQAQNPQCPDRPVGDSTNACANTRFVTSSAGLWVLDGTTVVNNTVSGYTTVRVTRSNTGNAGATLQLGHGNYMWTLIGNQLSGGDLILRNPAGGNVLVFPETGGCMSIQVNSTTCTYMLDIGSGGSAFVRINGSTFTNNLGPSLTFSGTGSLIGQISSDCVVFGATSCNNDFYITGPASSRHIGFYNWGGVKVTNTPTPVPTHYVGGALTVTTDSSNAFVGGNAITAQSDINTGGNFPTGMTIAMNVRNTTPGGPGATVWGIYSHCDLHATNGMAECSSIEGTLGNRYGAPNPPAVATIPGQPQPFLAALKGSCGGLITNNPNLAGLFGCSVGLWLHYYEGNGGWPFLYGAYLTEGVATTAGIMVQANATTPMLTAAEFRSAGGVGQRGVVIRNMGVSSANLALDFQNSAGASVASIQFNGVINFSNGGGISGLNTLTLANVGVGAFQLQLRPNTTMTANRILDLNMDADRSITLGGNINIAGNLTTSGANALTLTTTGATNVTLPTTGTLATLAGSETLSSKTLTSPTINGGTGPGLGKVTSWGGGYVAGRYYTGPQAGNFTTYAAAANIAYFFPMVIGETHTFDRIAIEVTAAGTAANMRLAIYNTAGGLPTTLVLDAGSTAIAGTGTKTTTISQSLAPGVYYLAVVLDGTATISALSQFSAGIIFFMGSSTTFSTTSDPQLSGAMAFGAYPATAFTGAMGAATWSQANVPAVALRG